MESRQESSWSRSVATCARASRAPSARAPRTSLRSNGRSAGARVSRAASRRFQVVAQRTLCPGLETADLEKVFAGALRSGSVVPLELVGIGGKEAVPDAVFEHRARGLRPDEGDRVCDAQSRCTDCEASDRAVQGSTGSGIRQEIDAVAAKAASPSVDMESPSIASRGGAKERGASYGG